MKPDSGWQGKLAAWAGWLLGTAVVLGLAALTLALSPDGARLRRLVGAKASIDRHEALGYAVAYEPERAGPGATADGAFETGPASGPPIIPAEGPAAQDSSGWVAADVIGAGRGVDVFVDGQWRGVTPVLVAGVPPGPHTLSFSIGNRSWDEQISVSCGDTTVAACAAPDGPGGGQLVIRLPDLAKGGGGAIDSILVDGRFVGSGGSSVEVGSGYHSVSFLRVDGVRGDVVLFVPEGSVQYISVPEPPAPFSVEGRPPVQEKGAIRFEARLRGSVTAPPKLSLLVLDKTGSSLKSAAMPWDASRTAYIGAVAAAELPPRGELRYFFRAVLDSGEEIDSPIYTGGLPES
jgi:hypothetical protein